jgi:formiminotetrahydrofolate cyclodeaminase
MVANLTLAKEKSPELEKASAQMSSLWEAALDDMAADAAAYEAVIAAQKMPRLTDEDKQVRTAAVQHALKTAAEVPLRTVERTVHMLELAVKIAPTARSGYVSDLGVGNFLALACVMSAAINVETNLHAIHDAVYAQHTHERLQLLEARAHELFGQLEAAVQERMAPVAR